MKRETPRYKVVAAYDTETTNISTFEGVEAFPVLHQLGISDNACSLRGITAENVEEHVTVECFRHASDAHEAFERLYQGCIEQGIVGVVMVHNLGFDMHSLALYINSHVSKVCAKSSTKPITIQICDDDEKPHLVFWDTLSLTAKSLRVMGDECGYPKAVGSWDYSLVRTPETELTDEELVYAKHDIFALFAYIGYWLRMNPYVEESMLALRVMTKTGAVRYKREKLFSSLKSHGKRCGQWWQMVNVAERPKTDDELFTMHASTRGGFTFTASSHAGVAYDLPEHKVVAGFDASSQHPAQMTSHLYPSRFEKEEVEILDCDLQIVKDVSPEQVMENWCKPFPVAFNMLVHIDGLRPKAGSIWEREGIMPLASARVSSMRIYREDNEQNAEFREYARAQGYSDTACKAVCEFGKLVSAESCEIWVTELEWWIVCQCYDFTRFYPVRGYETAHFQRPTDYSVLSVMEFYRGKQEFKEFMRTREATDWIRENVPGYLASQMEDGTANAEEVAAYYQTRKSDLNALYGIEVTNEARPDQYIDAELGISNCETKGLEDLKSHPATWYQFGQRIVGWSRIAQVINIILLEPHSSAVLNGDTDSVKCLMDVAGLDAAQADLARFGACVERARNTVCARVRAAYPDYYIELDGMGTYELEFTAQRYMSAWNKCYMLDEGDKPKMTVAGLPTGDNGLHGGKCLEAVASRMMESGMTFGETARELLSYNLTVDASVTFLNGRKIPKWASTVRMEVTDWRGKKALVREPSALALYPESKTIGSTSQRDNAANAEIAKANDPETKDTARLLIWTGEAPEILEM